MRTLDEAFSSRAIEFHILGNLRPNLMLTFNFNPARRRKPKTMAEILGAEEIAIEKAKSMMLEFFNNMQSLAFDKSWKRQTWRAWPEAYGFCEHPDTNIHYHVLVRTCPRFWRAVYRDGQGLWKTIRPGGTLDIRPVWNLEGAVEYCTKDLRRRDMDKAMFVYSDPRPPVSDDDLIEQILKALKSRMPKD